MSLISIVNLAERLLNQNSTGGQEPPLTQKSEIPATPQVKSGIAEDQFVPSSQSAQDHTNGLAVGPFNAQKQSFLATAAQFLLGQNGPTAANQSSAPSLQPAVSVAAAAVAAAPSGAPAQASAVPLGTTASTGIAALSSQELQSLNTALTALGLSAQDIQKVDQIASLINTFDPAAFTALVYQLEALAQQASASTPQTTVASSPAVGGNLGASQTTGGTYLRELVIAFAGINAQTAVELNANPTSQNAAPNPNGNLQAAAFTLQIEEVQLTLTNGSGQTKQVHAVPQNGNNARGASQLSGIKTRTRAATAQ